MTKNAISALDAHALTAGTKLILLDHGGHMSALPGAKAIVGPKGYYRDGRWSEFYLDVIWTDPVKAPTQNNGGYYPWAFALAETEREAKKRKALTPQALDVLKMMRQSGRITGVQAANVLKVRSLSRRIVDLKEAGYQIERELKVDHTGQRYAEYKLAA